MRRRDVLGALACGTAALAGCSTGAEPSTVARPDEDSTPPPDVTTFARTTPLPTPPRAPTREAARSFVAAHERRSVYNELVDGFGGSGPAVEIDVEPPRVAVVHAADEGYYLLSTCRGSAKYYDADGSPSGAGRNAASVAHFVGDDVHRRIPFNAYRCSDPVVTPSGDEEHDGDAPAARFQIYDFETEPDYDHPERGGHAVDVAVTDADGSMVLAREYRTSLPLTVQPRVTETPGEYTLSASLADADADTGTDGQSVEYDWSLSAPSDPSWWSLAVLVTYGGDLAVLPFHPNEAVGLPSGTLCRRLGE